MNGTLFENQLAAIAAEVAHLREGLTRLADAVVAIHTLIDAPEHLISATPPRNPRSDSARPETETSRAR